MDKHTRFHIDLEPTDAALLNRLTIHLSHKRGAIVSRPIAVREAIRMLAKKEKVA